MSKQQSKVHFTTSPQSESVSGAQDKQFKQFAIELDKLARQHGFSTYLVSVSFGLNPDLCSTAIGTMDEMEATRLLADAIRATKQLIQFVNPTAKGGIS